MELGAPPAGEAPEPAGGLEPEPDGLASPHVTAAMVAKGREAYGGGQSGTVHSFSAEEELAYANHINETLDGDVDCGHQLPIDTGNMQSMYDAIADGLVIPKLINAVINDEKLHIDRRALNRKKKLHPIQKVENHNLAINSCINIGVRVVNIGAMDLIEGKKHLVMGILWQIIKMGLLDDINLEQCPELYRLLHEGETIEQLLSLKPEEILLRWFNFHLEAAGSARRVNNFSSDVNDSECYTVLLGQISKGKCTQDPLSETDLEARAAKMLDEAGKIDCNKLITPSQVVAGNPRLNLAFIANLFNTCPGLEPLVEEEKAVVVEQAALLEVEPEDEGDSREERAFRAWFNSLNIDREVLNLYEQIGDGIILLQAEDKLQPGIVDWPSTYPMPKEVVHAATNCNFAVDYGRQLGCQLVNIGGKDIVDGNRKLILGLSWQLMRMSIFQMLAELEFNGKAVDEAGLIAWANSKVGDKAPHIASFQDKGLSDGKFLLHMLDAVRADAVDWDEVKVTGEGELNDDDKHENASYLINIARKIGCKVFLTWEDIVECQPKMITTLLAAALIVEQAPSEEELRAKQQDAELAARIQAAEDARKLAESKAKVAELEEKKKAEEVAAAQKRQEAASSKAEKAAADKAAAKSKMNVKAKKTAARKPPKGALDMSDPALEEAFQKVSDDADDTDWVWFGLSGNGSKMSVMEMGDDGLEGAVDELDDCRVMFGYVRCIMPDGRPKFVAITWVGMSAAEQQKGKVSSYKGQVEAFLDPNHLHVMAREEDDIDEEAIMAKLTKSGGASY